MWKWVSGIGGTVIADMIAAQFTDGNALMSIVILGVGAWATAYWVTRSKLAELEAEYVGAKQALSEVRRVMPSATFNMQTGTLCDNQGARLPDGVGDTALAKLREHT